MAGIITVIIILIVSIFITRVASIALTHTGLSREASQFQARSAFTGVGFTTDESEKVVNHPVRRKILQVLMILGNAGIVTGIASLIIGFSGIENNVSGWVKVIILVGSITILWYLANSKWADRHLSRLINKILKKYSRIDVNDYVSLLHLSGEFRISEIAIDGDHWLSNEKLKNTKLRDEGINVIALSRKNGNYLGNPRGDTEIKDGDTLIVYGRAETLNKIEKRSKGKNGKKEHNEMVEEQKEVLKHEKDVDAGD
ncbi:MAG: TrkA C-terminal domain-containing protein [Bacteroidales bacterium]|jgi:K+/H+ antiporter YhaU regulatory subunit KhtT|nr:TrkA C-terminal domain-containing protein [Bacteroidales bacterium]